MPAVHLPPSEQPDEGLDSAMELLRLARVTEGVAIERWQRSVSRAHDPLNSEGDRMLLTIQVGVNRYAALLWGREVVRREQLARTLGLIP